MAKLTLCCQILLRQHLILALNTLNAYTLILKQIFQTAQVLLHVPLQIFKVNQFNKGASWPCLWGFHFIVKCAGLSEARWTKMVIIFCVECSLISMIDYSIDHHDKNILFKSCWLHKLTFIRLCAYIISITIDYKCS